MKTGDSVTVGGQPLPVSDTGNVTLDGFEKAGGDFLKAYEQVGKDIGSKDDRRIDAEIRRQFWAQQAKPENVANQILSENQQSGRHTEPVALENVANELLAMQRKNPEQAKAVEASIMAKLDVGDQSRLAQHMKDVAGYGADADVRLNELGASASRHNGAVTEVRNLKEFASGILQDATRGGGGRGVRDQAPRDKLDVVEVVYQLERIAAADPELAQVTRKELEGRMSPQDAAQMNRMLAGDTWMGERINAAIKHPIDGGVGAAKGFVNGVGDLIDIIGKGAMLKGAAEQDRSAALQSLVGNEKMAADMQRAAAGMREGAKHEIVADIPYSNIAQAGGATVENAAELATGVAGAGKAMLKKVDDVAEVAGKQADEVAPPSPMIATEKGAVMPSELLALQGTAKNIGDFRGIEGATVENIISRVPKDWTLAPQQRGMGIRFIDQTGQERLRLHAASPGAPAGSNSSAGWTARVHVPGTPNSYYNSVGNVVGPKANEGHIPIYGNPNAGN